MGIDPKSLAAFASTGVEKKPKQEAAPEPVEPAPVEDDEDRYEELLPLLEEHAGEIEEAAAEMSGEALTALDEDLDSDDADSLREGFRGLEPALRSALQHTCVDMPLADCARLADSLEEDSVIEDQERFCGWLYRVGQMLGRRPG